MTATYITQSNLTSICGIPGCYTLGVIGDDHFEGQQRSVHVHVYIHVLVHVALYNTSLLFCMTNLKEF